VNRRNFLTGVIVSAAAGAVTLATDEEVSAFGTGTPARLTPKPELSPGLVTGPIDPALYVQTTDGRYVEVGLIRDILISSEPGRAMSVEGTFMSWGAPDPLLLRALMGEFPSGRRFHWRP
jgi:hypothetical protein